MDCTWLQELQCRSPETWWVLISLLTVPCVPCGLRCPHLPLPDDLYLCGGHSESHPMWSPQCCAIIIYIYHANRMYVCNLNMNGCVYVFEWAVVCINDSMGHHIEFTWLTCAITLRALCDRNKCVCVGVNALFVVCHGNHCMPITLY